MKSPKSASSVVLLAIAAVTVIVLGLQAPPVAAQSGLTITSPSSNAILPAGPDYASDILVDPWDMSNVEDISKDPEQRRGWVNFGFTSGRVGGTTDWVYGNQAGSSLAILERAWYGVLNPGRNGAKRPIDSGVYTKVAFKMGSARSDQFPRVFWFHNDLGHPAGEGAGWAGLTSPAPSGDSISILDLPSASGGGNPWAAAPVRGLSLYPNNSAVGYAVNFDWVRLTTGDAHPSAAKYTFTWNGGSGPSTVDIVDAGGTTLRIASNISGTQVTWNYGVLPPGTYTLRVTRGTTVTRTFRINAPPTLTITDPDETGGEDFASAVIGNAWDMSDGADVRLEVPSNHLLSPSFSGGQFHATSDGVAVATSADGIPVGDPMVYLLANNALINTSKYRYLTYRLQVDGNYDLLRGSVSRVFWGSDATHAFNLTTSKDVLAWPGMNSYSIDLGSLTTDPEGGIVPGGQLWSAANVRFLRLDPHEFAEQRGFHVDNVKLAAMDESGSGGFVIRFSGSDADGDPVAVALYYDTDRDPGNGSTLIAANVPLANGQYQWTTAGVPPGIYYIYAVASDGRNAVGTYSTGPLRIVTSGPVTNPLMNLEGPVNGSIVAQPFQVSGWAIDRGAPSGTGVDGVHVYAYPDPGSGAPAIFLGWSTGLARPDVGAVYGSQFTNSGFSVPVNGLRSGQYAISAYAHSTVTGNFLVHTVQVTVGGPVLAIDEPPSGSVREQPFTLGGWSIDVSAPSGTGVDAVHVWAYPNPGSGQAPVFVGAAQYGGSRPDVGAIFGTRFTNSGYSLTVKGLAPGLYQLSVYSRSTTTATFNIVRSILATVSNAPRMSLDTPGSGNVARTFFVGGWALDLAAGSGTGVDAIHVWAYPNPGSGQPAVWVGAASYGASRPDVGAAFGSQFTPSGYNLTATLGPGTYDLVVWAHSAISKKFDNYRVVRLTVQ